MIIGTSLSFFIGPLKVFSEFKQFVDHFIMEPGYNWKANSISKVNKAALTNNFD